MTLGWSANSGVELTIPGLDEPDDLVERTEVAAEGRQDRQARLLRRRLAARDVLCRPAVR